MVSATGAQGLSEGGGGYRDKASIGSENKSPERKRGGGVGTGRELSSTAGDGVGGWERKQGTALLILSSELIEYVTE